MNRHGEADRAGSVAGAGAQPNGNGGDMNAEALDMVFITKNVSEAEQAAVIATLGQLREEETQQVKQVARRENEPWRRSQRNPEGINEFTE
jgi:hypothetical protein